MHFQKFQKLRFVSLNKKFQKKKKKKKFQKKKKKNSKKKKKKFQKIMIPKISQNFTVMNYYRAVKISNMNYIKYHQFISI